MSSAKNTITLTAKATVDKENYVKKKSIYIIIIYYNKESMTKMFKAKVRKVGTSLGVLIPKEIATEEKIKEGEKVEVSLLKEKRLEEVFKLFGTAKGTKPFVRDREDRIDR